MGLDKFIRDYDFRWTELQGVTDRATEFFDRLVENRDELTSLIDRALEDPTRRGMCEIDEIRTKLVLYDHPQGEFRLRLHVWQDDAPAIVHTHRFAYVARVLKGGYRHALYVTGADLLSDKYAQYDDQEIVLRDAPADILDAMAGIKPGYFGSTNVGQTYAQGERGTLSSTEPVPGTISLFVRGPTTLPRAFQWDQSRGVVTWKRGAAESSPEDAAKLLLQDDALRVALASLSAAGLYAGERAGQLANA